MDRGRNVFLKLWVPYRRRNHGQHGTTCIVKQMRLSRELTRACTFTKKHGVKNALQQWTLDKKNILKLELPSGTFKQPRCGCWWHAAYSTTELHTNPCLACAAWLNVGAPMWFERCALRSFCLYFFSCFMLCFVWEGISARSSEFNWEDTVSRAASVIPSAFANNVLTCCDAPWMWLTLDSEQAIG